MDAQRLRSGLSFSRVFEEGCTIVGRLVVIHYLRGVTEHPRVGFAAGKKLGGAVVRNRFRRRLREAFRHLPGELAPVDLVLVARSAMQEASFEQIQKDLMRVLSRARLLRSASSF